MTTRIIKNILWDYGGVFTQGSRFQILLSLVDDTQRKCLTVLEDQGFFKNAASGDIALEQMLNKIHAQCCIAPNDFLRIAAHASQPLSSMCQLVQSVYKEVHQYVISDNIPAYTETVKHSLGNLTERIFLSDEFRARKSQALFQTLAWSYPEIFDNALYIDDNINNIVTIKGFFPRLFTHHFRDQKTLRHFLLEMGLLPARL